MRLIQQHHHGFTLIELIITVAIAAMVIGGGIAGFVSFTDRQEVLNTAKEVQQMMRTAQSKARVRDVPSSCTNPDKPLLFYQVEVQSSEAVLRAGCGTFGSPVLVEVNKKTFPNNVTGPASTIILRFTTLEEGVTDGTNLILSSPQTITIKKAGSTSFNFNVAASGQISNIQ